MKTCLTLEVLLHLGLAVTSTQWVATLILFGFGCYAFVWGTLSTSVRQRAVPTELQGRVGSVYRVGVYGGIVLGNLIGGLLARSYGILAPYWVGFVGDRTVPGPDLAAAEADRARGRGGAQPGVNGSMGACPPISPS